MSRAFKGFIAGFIFIGLLSAPATAGMWGPRQSGRVAVTVYEHADFSGRQSTFYGDTAWLPRGISSIRIQGRCTVTLFNNYNFRGRNQNITSDVRNLQGTIVGNDRVLSLAISPFQSQAPGGSATGEVILYEHSRLKGRSQKVTGDVADLTGTYVGNDAVSSIRIKDAEVTVYEHANFRGRSQTFNGSVQRLMGTVIGNDTISSIRVRWFSNSGGGSSNEIKAKPFKSSQ